MPAQSPNSTILVGALLLLMLPSPVGAQTEEEVEAAFWRSVACEDAEDMELYLETFPDGAYVTEAAGCLERGSDLDREAHITIQQGLASLDFSMGPADGLFGPTTRSALRLWQGQKGFATTGYLTREQADVLIAQGGAAVAQEQEREAAARAAAEQVRQERAAAEEARRQRQAEEQRQRAAAEEARRQRAEAERAARREQKKRPGRPKSSASNGHSWKAWHPSSATASAWSLCSFRRASFRWGPTTAGRVKARPIG